MAGLVNVGEIAVQAPPSTWTLRLWRAIPLVASLPVHAIRTGMAPPTRAVPAAPSRHVGAVRAGATVSRTIVSDWTGDHRPVASFHFR